MTRGTALVANVAAVVKLTGVQDLANLEADAELTLTDLLTTASDAIYDRLQADGVDPTKLTNQTVFERAVAFQFLELLAISGYLSPSGEDAAAATERYRAAVDRFYGAVRVQLSDGDEPRSPHEAIPSVGNFSSGSAFGPSGGTQQLERYWNNLQEPR